MIFRRYLALPSVHALREELTRSGVVSKQRRRSDGSGYGGGAFTRGALYFMLQNRLYRGEITHKGEVHPGEHEAIIDPALWDEVEAKLAGNRDEPRSGRHTKQPNLLGGMLVDAAGHALTPTYANKGSVRYRYYVSSELIRGELSNGPETGPRIGAQSGPLFE